MVNEPSRSQVDLLSAKGISGVIGMALASATAGIFGGDFALGGTAAREQAAREIAQAQAYAERRIEAAELERDRTLESVEQLKLLYLECNKARMDDR